MCEACGLCYHYSLGACLFSKKKRGAVDLDRKQLGGDRRGETIIRMYCMKKRKQ